MTATANTDRWAAFLAARRRGHSVTGAAAVAGLPVDAVTSRLMTDERLAAADTRMTAELTGDLLGVIRAAADTDKRAADWLRKHQRQLAEVDNE